MNHISILLMVIICANAYMKIPMTKSKTNPTHKPSFAEKFHQNETSLAAYHIAMLLP